MTFRSMLAATLVACTLGCAAETPSLARIREGLDEYVIAKPVEQAWTDALRFLNERGYPPVGADRKRLELPEMGSWATAASKGSETKVSGNRWTADTQADGRGRRYRIIGVVLSPTTCRIGFFAVNDQSVVTPSDDQRRETMYRDSVVELNFIQTFDPEGARKMSPKDPGFF
jgi:hypothetical protein